jgi:TonB-linked SusC/RagA family outer membrane protein
MNMMKQLILMFSFLFFTVSSFAQTKVVTGKVTDENGAPVSNVSVFVKNTNIGTTTKADGTYSINLTQPAKAISFSAVDFNSTDLAVPTNGVLNVKLTLSNNKLDDVVVVAYGTTKKSNFTGSAATITAKEFQDRPLTSVANALIGAAPGIASTSPSGQPGSSPAIRIRGFGSISASSDPLYIVDGVPFTSSIANLNMDDVESLSVLKDAATTSLYGSRAANGVVMITTKKGKVGRNNVTFKYNSSVNSRAIPNYDRVGPADYYTLMWEAYRNSLAYRASSPLSLTAASNQASGLVSGQNGIVDVLGYNAFDVPKNALVNPDGTFNSSAKLRYRSADLDWFDPVTRNGIRNDYSMNFSGGLDKTDYFVSFNYLKEEGYIKRSDFQRFSVRANVNSQLKSWLKTGVNINFTKSGGLFASTDGSNSIVNPFFFAARMGPIFPIYMYQPNSSNYLLDINGNRQYDFGNSTGYIRPSGAYGGRHTIAENELSNERFSRNVFNGRTYAEVKLYEGLKLTTNFAADIQNRMDLTYQNKIIGDGAPAGRSSKSNQLLTNYTFNQLLSYNKKVKEHNFDVLLGHENYSNNQDFLSGTRQGQVVDGNFELINFTTTTSLSSSQDNHTIESYFGNLKYDLGSKYFLTLGGRTDGNSRFGSKVRWGKFWSASAAWLISKEKFMENVKFVNFLKLRSSYGTTGNDAGISFYASQNLYNLGLNNGLTPGILQSTSLGNDSLTWEANGQFDIGIDFTLFDNRISGSFEYFKRQTNNLLFSVPLPISSGVSSISKNIGGMYNKGLELQLDAEVIRTKDFTWKIGINATTVKNQITKMPQKEIISGTKKLMVGKSIFDYWLRQWHGVDPKDGAALFVADPATITAATLRITPGGDSVTTDPNRAKYDYVGSSIPDVYGAINTSVRYKQYTISTIANYQIGGLTYDDTYAAFMHAGTYGASLHTDMLKRWKNPGDITNVPRMDNAQTSFFGATSSRFLTSATFLNIQNVTLSYDHTFASKKPFNSARIYISAENVRMFTKRYGMNPSQSFAGVTSIGYIPAAVFNIGVNINL